MLPTNLKNDYKLCPCLPTIVRPNELKKVLWIVSVAHNDFRFAYKHCYWLACYVIIENKIYGIL